MRRFYINLFFIYSQYCAFILTCFLHFRNIALLLNLIFYISATLRFCLNLFFILSQNRAFVSTNFLCFRKIAPLFQSVIYTFATSRLHLKNVPNLYRKMCFPILYTLIL
jgi:hypothetical protein